MDVDLLTILSDRERYTRFKPYVQEHVLTKEARLIYNTLDSYYKFWKTTNTINWSSFSSHFFKVRAHQITSATAPLYHTIFDKLSKHSGVGDAQTEDILKSYVLKNYIDKIASAANSTASDDVKLDALKDIVEECDKELQRAVNPAQLFVSGELEDVAKEVTAPGYEWRLEEMNVSLGPLRKGNFVIVAGRPETGKTTFVADQVGYMATQIDDARPVVWINNEERSENVDFRIKQAVLGWTQADMLKDLAVTKATYLKLVKDPHRIRVLSNDSGVNDVTRLTALFQSTNPAIIVFDQLDKVYGFSKEERDDLRLGRLYLWARELAHKYGPVIALSQADATADNVRFIQMGQLRGSKTDKVGEADAIITIGRDTTTTHPNQRFINVPKNKLYGGPKSEVDQRHGMWEVEIQPEIARYRGTR